jgi:hypothetical protein
VGGFKCKIVYLESLAVTRFSKKLIAPTYLAFFNPVIVVNSAESFKP